MSCYIGKYPASALNPNSFRAQLANITAPLKRRATLVPARGIAARGRSP